MNLKLIILLFAIIGMETGAQYFLQKTTKTNKKIFLMIGVLMYAAVGAIYYAILNQGDKLAVANSFWNAGTEVTVALVGFAFFGQHLTVKQVVGLVLVIIGVNILG